jgi:hypothetical protein
MMLTQFGADEFDRVHSEPAWFLPFTRRFSVRLDFQSGLMSDPHRPLFGCGYALRFAGYQNQIYDEVELPFLGNLSSRVGRICVFCAPGGETMWLQCRHPRNMRCFDKLVGWLRAAEQPNRNSS